MIEQSEKTLKQAGENLIKAGTTFDIEQLDLIYHKNLKVFMVDTNGQSNMLDKNSVLTMFQSKRDNGDAHLNNWAEYSNIDLNGDLGHIIVVRKVNLTGIEQKFVFSLELVWEENRWQVTREVAVMQPEN
ncbi:hypothetical protein H9I45_04765 [Polaribacter haliotis]|uniref:Nuclear transport factor 2 family protein n=1 Tax=Polaribacter haliotis TaxID=1888915 RepID=A0A7L8AID0_9FLAO|nr:hypothetical protein [Polaribacter haliotis]QOD61762.1 hypothetical protein H9I45_04765 [Polaribacter haliotis]